MTACPLVSWTDPSEPRLWRRTFPGASEYVQKARELVCYLLADTPVVSDAVLATSEMVTNSLRHSRAGQPGGTFTLEVRRGSRSAEVSITDDGDPDPSLPHRHAAHDDGVGDGLAEGGRGLAIVRAIAQTVTRRGGKTRRTYTAEFSW